jgi:hypothetical protein
LVNSLILTTEIILETQKWLTSLMKSKLTGENLAQTGVPPKKIGGVGTG